MDDGRKTLKDVFRSVFGSEDGKTMLYWILDQCGYFAQNATAVRPELLSFANRLLALGDVNSPLNAGAFMKAIMDVSGRNIPDKEEDDAI